ncbi:unnamed protein product [Cunninghamella blakesleeana]
MSNLQKALFKKGIPSNLNSVEEEANNENNNTGIQIPLLSKGLNTERYAPIPWDHYFEKKEDILCNESDTFRVYSLNTQYTPDDDKERKTIFIMHHGAGDGALSFSLVAKLIFEKSNKQCGITAIDCRGHGDTKTKDDNDFSLKRLSDDMISVITKLYPENYYDFILVGHSMGGSVVVDVAYSKQLPNVMGVVVMDVVEGSALEAIQSMDKFLSTRPTSFQSIEQAIQWSFKSKMVRRLDAAKVSIPPLVKFDDDLQRYIWRTDLQLTKPYWTEWFTNLSEKFLGSPVSKLLLLAGTDRLDKTLTIAQMQGNLYSIY